MFTDALMAVLLSACIAAVIFAVLNGVVSVTRWQTKRRKILTDYEESLIREAARRDTFEEVARFTREYTGDWELSSKIRQLYHCRLACPECNGKGKKWVNSTGKCPECWGTGKQLPY